MNFYYDQQQHCLYLTSNRNGSTILLEISNVYSHLIPIDTLAIFEYLKYNPDMPIYCAFRDPYVRFVSGLEVQFYNATGVTVPDSPPVDSKQAIHIQTVLEQYKVMLRSLAAYSQITGSFYIYPRVPYHLYDEHLDHWLWAPAVLGAYDYNVKLIPMNEFSYHLIRNFPKAESLIKKRERPNSYDTVKKKCVPLMDAFREIMIDSFEWGPAYKNENPDNLITWDKWMGVEQEIYLNYRLHCNHPSPSGVFNKLLDRIMDDPFYTSDIQAPRIPAMNFLICGIHELKPHKSKVKKMHMAYLNARTHVNNFLLKQYENKNMIRPK